MYNFLTRFTACVTAFAFLASCALGTGRETSITTASGTAEAALPYQAVFAADKNTDARLISAAKKFCERTAEFSNGNTVFSFVLSDNALDDLRSGKADAILLENTSVPDFSIMSEAFLYKSYEHFSMTANSSAVLQRLSELLGANVFAGFYAGSNVLIGRGPIDSKFRAARRDTDGPVEARAAVTALDDSTAHSFSLLGADVLKEKELGRRISSFAEADRLVEFSPSELDSSALLEAIYAKSSESVSGPVPDGEIKDANTGPASHEPEPLTVTRAFTGIKPVWLVFAPLVYEELSQAGLAAASEAAAYMTADVDGVYIEYEREKMKLLADADVAISNDFAATRVQAARLSGERDSGGPVYDRKLTEAISRLQ